MTKSKVKVNDFVINKSKKSEEVLVSNSKLYELSLEERKHKEDRRDQINSYYISLFAAIIAISPFIDKIAEGVSELHKGYIIRVSLTVLASIGLILAIAWAANLRRLLAYLQSVDKLILDMESKHSISFITYISQQLHNKHSPDRITKYQIVLPYTFAVIFISTIIYSLGWIIAK